MATIAGTCPLGTLLRNSVSENNRKNSVVHYEGLRLPQRTQIPSSLTTSPSHYISASSCKILELLLPTTCTDPVLVSWVSVTVCLNRFHFHFM